jgi:putative transposase
VKDAYETMVKYWASIAESLRPLVYRKRNWTDAMRHYAFWLLAGPTRVAALYAGTTPLPTEFEIPKAERSAVVEIIAREVRKRVVRLPRVQKARSMALDADMYTVTASATGRQQIAVMGFTPRKRITIPLLGTGPISGNIRVIMEPGARTCEIHTIFELKVPSEPPAGNDAGADIGQSEVLTDDHGKRYGKQFGKFLARASKIDLDKGRKRGKLHAVRKKALARGDKAKARRIKTNNLGYKKLDNRRRKHQAECARFGEHSVQPVPAPSHTTSICPGTPRLPWQGEVQGNVEAHSRNAQHDHQRTISLQGIGSRCLPTAGQPGL